MPATICIAPIILAAVMLFHEIPQFFKVLIPPAAEPLAASDLHAQLRIDSTFEDTLINQLITVAREFVENDTRRALVYQTQLLVCDQFPYWGQLDRQSIERTSQATGVFYGGEIEIRRPPVLSVQALQYLDTTGALQTLDTANYITDLISEPARAYPAYGIPWPITRWQANAVQLTFQAGYATPITSINLSTHVITTPRAWNAGDAFLLFNAGGALPTPLLPQTVYYVVNPVGNTLQLSLTSGGTPVAISDAGTGANFIGIVPQRAMQAIRLLVAHWYRNREAVGTVGQEIALAYNSCINRLRWSLE